MPLALPAQPESPQPRPFVKWAGGKRRLLPEIKKLLPKKWGRYFEPFLGGGALFWELLPQDAWLSDNNPHLMEAWEAVQQEVELLLRRLRRLRWSEADYYRIRAQDPQKLTRTQAAARVIYLNKTCFNGLWRVNAAGKHNVPFGRYAERPQICDAENLRACHRALAGAGRELHCCSFEKIYNQCEKHDLVYFDPPYVPVSKTASFTAYGPDAFGEDQQRRLAELFTELSDDGVYCILSQSDAPLVRELYGDYPMRVVSRSGSISSNVAGRGRVPELLVWSGSW